MDVICFQEELEKRSKKDIIAYANAQFAALEAASQKLKQQEEEIKHLQCLLESNVKPIIKPSELLMVEHQIEKLLDNSNKRNLSHEEIKSLDILVKNKLLLNGQATTIPGQVKHKKDLPEAVLISIAKKESQ